MGRVLRMTYRMLLAQCIFVLVIIILVFSNTFNSWTKTKPTDWKKPSMWYPRLQNLVTDIDKFLWSEIEMDELARVEKSVSELSESFVEKKEYPETTKNSSLERKRLENEFSKFNEPGYIDPDEFPREFCPKYPQKVEGWIDMPDFWKHEPPTLKEIAKKYPNFQVATSKPSDCKARNRVAIIIPLRDREMQLRGLLSHMHPIWQRQQIDYTVYLVTQSGKVLFNRAKLMNIGFTEARKERKYDCYVFHDVDLLLENDKCLYWCPSEDSSGRTHPRHLSTYIDKFGYEVHSYDLGLCSPLTYQNMNVEVFGGVSMFTEEQFITVNGFSNMYWGWGAEDDDLFMRTWKKGYKITHDTSSSCSFHMIYHKRERTNRINAIRYLLLKHAISRQKQDGLSNLRYKILSKEKTSIYTNITVNIGSPPPRLRELMKEMSRSSEDVNSYSCFESLIWMYHKMKKKQ